MISPYIIRSNRYIHCLKISYKLYIICKAYFLIKCYKRFNIYFTKFLKSQRINMNRFNISKVFLFNFLSLHRLHSLYNVRSPLRFLSPRTDIFNIIRAPVFCVLLPMSHLAYADV